MSPSFLDFSAFTLAKYLREKSPARRFLTTGLDMLTRNTTTSPPVSSPEASDTEQDQTDGRKKDRNPTEQNDSSEITDPSDRNEEKEVDVASNADPYNNWVSGYVASANIVKKQLFTSNVASTSWGEGSSSKSVEVVPYSETEVAQGVLPDHDATTSTENFNIAPTDQIKKQRKRKGSIPLLQGNQQKDAEADATQEKSRTSTRELRRRQESPKRKLHPFNFELKKRKRGPDFTVTEEREIVEHFKTKGGFNKRGGNAVWKEMELAGVCHPRSWQSLKQRFHAYILPDLDHFGVTEEELLAVTVKEVLVQEEDTFPEKALQLELTDDEQEEEEEEEDFEDASEELPPSSKDSPSTPARGCPDNQVVSDDLSLPSTPINSSIKGSAVPGTPVYECQVLADRQAELLSEIRQLSRGITVGRMAPPGTPSKEGGRETLQEKARRTQSAPPATKPKDQHDKEKSRQQRASVEKEVLPDVEKVKHRTPYSEQEERGMIDYFLKYGGFLCKS